MILITVRSEGQIRCADEWAGYFLTRWIGGGKVDRTCGKLRRGETFEERDGEREVRERGRGKKEESDRGDITSVVV